MNWFRQHKHKKLDYTPLVIDGVTFYVARSESRSMHITVKSDLKAYAVCNYTEKQTVFEDFLRDHIEWVKKAVESQKNDFANVKLPVNDEEKERLKKKLDIYIKRYQIMMDAKVAKWSIRNMDARWGSCTVQDRTIRFSSSLAHCSDEFIEYVVVHELAHLFEANHSKKFWSIVEKYIPDFKTRRHMYVNKDD